MMLMMAEMVESDCWFLHFHNLYSLLGKPLKEGLVYVFLTKTAVGGSGEVKEGPEQENFSKSEKHGDNEAADSGLVSKPSLIV